MTGPAGDDSPSAPRAATWLALGAIALWAGLALAGVALAHLPPFLVTGLALAAGSVPTWPRWREWRVPPATLALGVYGLFGFHFLLFVALRLAPPVQANLVNYLWPLLIVVLAPVLLPGLRLRPVHVVASLGGFAGAALAIAGAGLSGSGAALGYAAAFGSAVVWSTYSLLTRRVAPFPTAAVGLFALVSAALSLVAHGLAEPRVLPSACDVAVIAATGLGPMGIAFLLWDAALKRGDPRTIGVLSYLTPLGSTALLVVATGRPFGWPLAAATGLIVGSAVLALRAERR